MPNYLLAYHGGSMPDGEEAQAESLEAWNEWMDAVGEHLLDGVNPIGQSMTVGAGGVATETGGERVTGYSIIEAIDIEAALELAATCPIIADGGTVEVAELLDMLAFDNDLDEDDEADDQDD
jgi:hypothetical protein